mgnify:CR=1 FL=1
MWLVEPSTFIGAGERHIAEQLQGIGVPVILIINKLILYQRKKSFLPLTPTESMRFRRDYPMLRTAWTEYTGYYRLYPEISALRSYVL